MPPPLLAEEHTVFPCFMMSSPALYNSAQKIQVPLSINLNFLLLLAKLHLLDFLQMIAVYSTHSLQISAV